VIGQITKEGNTVSDLEGADFETPNQVPFKRPYGTVSVMKDCFFFAYDFISVISKHRVI